MPRQQQIRSCIGCGQRAAQSLLLRVQLDGDGRLTLVHRSGRAGRSGYLHSNKDCWQRFASRKGPVRSLARNFDRDARRAFIMQLENPAGTCGPGSGQGV